MGDLLGDAAPEVVVRLAVARGNEAPFLAAHHVEAARRLARLFERARMRQRVTMSYDPTRLGGRAGGGSVQADLSVSAEDARRSLANLAEVLPVECWNVLFDVCGFDKGMQDVEIERDWPRRSGKLVLRIALSQLAGHFGLSATAEGQENGRHRHWRPERVAMFPE
jgi:hypothetical protein